MSKRRKRKPCAIDWCAAEATRGAYCPVHAEAPSLHPDYRRTVDLVDRSRRMLFTPEQRRESEYEK